MRNRSPSVGRRVARITRACAGHTERLRRAFAPDHFNYAFLQNQNRHVHLHVIPRYATDLRCTGPAFRGSGLSRPLRSSRSRASPLTRRPGGAEAVTYELPLARRPQSGLLQLDTSARVHCAAHLADDVFEKRRRGQTFRINADDWTLQRKRLPVSREELGDGLLELFGLGMARVALATQAPPSVSLGQRRLACGAHHLYEATTRGSRPFSTVSQRSNVFGRSGAHSPQSWIYDCEWSRRSARMR